MFSVRLLCALLIGIVAMLIPIYIQIVRAGISRWKSVPIALIFTIVGVVGTKLLFLLENGRIGGQSFYGAVFFVPIVAVLVVPMLRIPYGTLLDLCAPAECVMLVIMKVQCIRSGCCSGRLLFTTGEGEAVLFPSAIVELIVAAVLFAILFCWALKGKKRGKLYAWYLLLYGCMRFVLNILREEWVTKEMLLPFGNIWSLVAIVVAVIVLLVVGKKNKQRSV